MVMKITIMANYTFFNYRNIKNKISNKICLAVALGKRWGQIFKFYLHIFIKRFSI